MIFVTVGTQLPFDRLLWAVDQWALEKGGYPKVFAQIGPSSFSSTRIETVERLSVEAFKQAVEECDVLVSHAGMGSILTALTYQKPIIVMPRLAKLGEHRNDHQLSTASKFSRRKGITVAETPEVLSHCLDQVASLESGLGIEPFASADLIATIQNFIVKKDVVKPEIINPGSSEFTRPRSHVFDGRRPA